MRRMLCHFAIAMCGTLLCAITTVHARQSGLRVSSNGLEQSQIAGMVHLFGKRRARNGYSHHPDEANWLVLKDGWAYKNPIVAPTHFDAVASRRKAQGTGPLD